MNYNHLVDSYIEKAKPFAQPILIHLRELVHKACPNVEENIKWGMPFFDFMGPMCNIASFNAHCSFGFWKAALMKDPILLETAKSETAMGHLGKITSLKDLPNDKKIISYINEAMQLNIDGIKIEKPKPVKKEVVIPNDLLKVLKRNKKAFEVFEAFSPSQKREYIDWITDAKTQVTKDKRTEQMLLWLEEGKTRNWKYKF